MLLNSTVSIWTKIRPSLVAATRIHWKHCRPACKNSADRERLNNTGAINARLLAVRNWKVRGKQQFFAVFCWRLGIQDGYPKRKTRNCSAWICEMVGFPVIWVAWEELKCYRFYKRKPRSLNTIRIHTASLLSIDGYIVSNVRELTLGADWKKGTLGAKIDKCIALSGTQSS